MDLTIFKADNFLSTGKVRTKTYTKPNHQAQYLPFASQHSLHCRLGIYRGEARRHLLNCDCEDDYELMVSALKRALVNRGYPKAVLPRIPYDRELRNRLLQKLSQRQRSCFGNLESKVANNTIVMKCAYTSQIRRLRFRAHWHHLLHEMRTHLGGAFMKGTRLIMAHPTGSTSFLSTYELNFV